MIEVVLVEVDEQEEFHEGQDLFGVLFPVVLLEEHVHHYYRKLRHGDYTLI